MNGSCHCGAVQITAPNAPENVTECHCSICRRYGALWAYYPTASVGFSGPTTAYVWGRRYIEHLRCDACGCVVGWMPRDRGYAHCGVNARMFDGLDLETVERIVEEDASD
ncbi:GFA family protein [Methylopila sp. M107]|uniref:GFA family protein n=1 Tax=Methylopila sp. M107 TaxID=1101190 RepID=UPI0003799099|nr:GFA family protein [Methylopila sp. M107]